MNIDIRKVSLHFLLLSVGIAMSMTETPAGAAVSVREVRKIRNTAAPLDNQMKKIELFVQEQVRSMLKVKDQSELKPLINNLMENSQHTSNQVDTRRIYSHRFSSALHSVVKNAYEQADQFADQNLRWNIKLGLAFVTANANNPVLIEDLILFLKDKSEAVRYWAAKGLSLPIIQEYVQSNNVDNQNIVADLLKILGETVENENNEYVIAQIARAAPVKYPEGVNILKGCISKRISQYKDWTVADELVDLEIVEVINRIIERGNIDRGQAGDLMLGVAKIVTLAYLRYTEGMTYKNADGKKIVLLPERNQEYLKTFLIQAERLIHIITKSGAQQGRLKNILLMNQWNKIKNALRSILISIDKTFEIYPPGTPSGSFLEELPPPPARIVERALIRVSLDKKGSFVGDDQY